MTLQQMEYIVAVDKFRHYMKAANACHVTQSTLSMMIKKLEDELDTIIFDRDAHPIKPTHAGEMIIAQARVVLYNTEQLRELTVSERLKSSGEVKLAIIPTVAADIIPGLMKNIQEDSPNIHLRTYEMQTCHILEKLYDAELDMAIMATPLENTNLLEIPIYYERLAAYVSPSDELYTQKEIVSGDIPAGRMWVLSEGNCLRDQVFNICEGSSEYTARYESGSIDTLIRIVDSNGGFTIIPELHIPYLDAARAANVRDLVAPEVVREISLVIRKDYVRERILNEVINAVKKTVPDSMIDSALKKFAIRI